jgi:hypothetical protein
MPVSTYEAIGSFTTNTALAQVTFSNIPQNYTDLVLVTSAIANTTGADIYVVTLNGDNNTGNNNYSLTDLYGTGSAAGGYRVSLQPGFVIGNLSTSSSSEWAPTIYNFNNYSNPTTNKNVLVRSNSATTTGLYVDLAVGLWRKKEAINSISLRTVNGYGIKAGTTFNLYGIGANTLKATGGDIIQSDGTYWYHAFTSSGTFTPTAGTTLSCDIIVAAGGGGGGGSIQFWGGGGGGAGGVLAHASQSISSAQTVIVGAGGRSSTTTNEDAMTSGNNSQFGSLTASIYGGLGGTINGRGGTFTAGSSGGVMSTAQTPNAATAGQGFIGGTNTTPSHVGSGGGGAGGIGVNNASDPSGSAGGPGINTKTNWGVLGPALTATGLGVSGYIAGGGGGGSAQPYGTVTQAVGGIGGGGAGGVIGANGVTNGVRNTGSGGGGGAATTVTAPPNGVSGSGGSGLVIVRYPV